MKVCYIILFIFVSCTQAPVIRRGSGGYQSYNKTPVNNNAFASIKKKVALLELFNESPYGKEDLAIHTTQELKKELSRTRDYVVDNESGHLFGTSKEVYSGGGMKLAQLSRKAKLSGINLVIYGRITMARVRQKKDEIGFLRKVKSYSELILELRVFDVNANKEIYAEKINGNVNDSNMRFFMSDRKEGLIYKRKLMRYSARVAVKRFLPKLAKLGAKLDWTGRVAKIIGSKIYINAGRKSGIQTGDVLKVLTEGQEVFDPESGALLGVSKGEVKGTLEIVDYFGPDGAVAILHSGGSVTEGDFVQLY